MKQEEKMLDSFEAHRENVLPFTADMLKVKGWVNYKHIRDGKVINEFNLPNLVVSVGKKRAADLLGGTNTPATMTALAIGTGTNAAAAGDTALQTEITTQGGQRHAATVTNITTTTTGDTEQWQWTWTFTGSFAVTEEGILDNNASGGTLLARNTFSAVNVVSGDSLQVTHKIQFS